MSLWAKLTRSYDNPNVFNSSGKSGNFFFGGARGFALTISSVLSSAALEPTSSWPWHTHGRIKQQAQILAFVNPQGTEEAKSTHGLRRGFLNLCSGAINGFERRWLGRMRKGRWGGTQGVGDQSRKEQAHCDFPLTLDFFYVLLTFHLGSQQQLRALPSSSTL